MNVNGMLVCLYARAVHLPYNLAYVPVICNHFLSYFQLFLFT